MSKVNGYSLHVPGSNSTTGSTRFNAWVVCQFAKDPSVEHLLAIGDENGFIHFLDAREDTITKSISADRSCVIDVSFVANRPNNLLSISGHAKVTSWDIERQLALQQFVGHEGSVRALSVSDDNPELFATGARDGTICIWDRREPQATVVRPFNLLESTHPLLAPERQSIGTKRRSRTSVSMSSKGITSLVHYGGNTLISASSSFKTGIRFWDLRYRGKNSPFRILEDPNSTSIRDFGIASICLDRFSSSLFVASTDSKIYQYSIQGLNNTPVGILQGVKRTSFNTYDFKIAASPNSDYIMFGGGDCFAVIWDLQEKYSSFNKSKLKYLPYPKYTLGGHRYEVTVARFSNCGHYIATMDDSYLKIWKWNPKSSEDQESSPISIQDRVELYELPETARAEMSMKELDLSISTPKKKTQRSPFKSPFKSPLNRVGVEGKSGSGSPVKKMFKITEQLSPPLCDLTNKSSHAARKLDFSGIPMKNRVLCAFHFKYPTMNLPDFVKERLAVSNVNSESESTILDKGKNSELNKHSSNSDRPSNCSNMISMKERADRTSPRKIRVKQSLWKSRERMHRQSVKMPAKSRTDSQSSRHSQNPSIDVRQLTPKPRKTNGTQRTLDQYFSRTPRTY
ncbi:WD domain G-beta repeat family protein [Acanthocheilonema viteae]